MSDSSSLAAAPSALNLEPRGFCVRLSNVFLWHFFWKIRLQSAVNFYGATVVAVAAVLLLDLLAHLRFNWPFIGWPRRLAK